MNAGGTLFVIVIFIVALGFVWVYTGGPGRAANTSSGPFLGAPAPEGTSSTPSEQPPANQSGGYEAYASKLSSFKEPAGSGSSAQTKSLLDYYSTSKTGEPNAGDSPYKSDVTLSKGNAREIDPQTEYITIKTTRQMKTPVTITNWTLEAVSTGVKVKIGEASQLPFLGAVSTLGPITIPAGSIVYVNTGRSPNGTSFRINQCTGYFAQFQNFEPYLPGECPTPADEMLLFPQKVLGNDQCVEFVQRLPACTFQVMTIPGAIGSSCQDFILNQLSYNGCITTHRYDPEFYKPEWRVFLNRTQELWKKANERIRLLDENGKLVAELTY